MRLATFYCYNKRMLKSNDPDKRKTKRHNISATALISIKEIEDAGPIYVLVAGISKSVLGVYSYAPIPEGHSVSIDISFLGFRGIQKDKIEGKVSLSTREEDIHYIEIDFDKELSPETQPVLYENFWRLVNG